MSIFKVSKNISPDDRFYLFSANVDADFDDAKILKELAKTHYFNANDILVKLPEALIAKQLDLMTVYSDIELIQKSSSTTTTHNDYEKILTTLLTQLICRYEDANDDRSLLNRANRVLNVRTINSFLFNREEILAAIEQTVGNTMMSDDFGMISFVSIFRSEQNTVKILTLGVYDILQRDLPDVFSLLYLKQQDMPKGRKLTKEAKNDSEERRKRKLFEARSIVLLNKF